MTIDLVAGNPGLDLANNRQRMRDLDPERPYLGLLNIATRSGALDGDEAARLARAALRRPADAAAVVVRADALAAATRGVLGAAIDGREPPRAALATINHEVAQAESHARIVAADSRFERCWQIGSPMDLARPLWPLAHEVGVLLVAGQLERTAMCDAPDCDWFFVDTSKNHSRRWCDMGTCGNRAKVERFRARTA